jgi:hypothetical protein
MLDSQNLQIQEMIRRAQRVPSDGTFPGTGLHEQGQRRPNFVPTDEPAPTTHRRSSRSSTALTRTPPAQSASNQRNDASSLLDLIPSLPESRNGQTNVQVNFINSPVTINNGTPAAPAQPATQPQQGELENFLATAFIALCMLVAGGVVLFAGYWLLMFIIGLLTALLPILVLGAALVFIVAVCIGIASNF